MARDCVRICILCGFGAVIVIVSAVMLAEWPGILRKQIENKMTLTKDSIIFNKWRVIADDHPFYIEYYMWNITNVNEILKSNSKVKPNLVQVGPYVYRQTVTKDNITWNENNTITFYNRRQWIFDEQLSNGTLSDKITSFNPILATVAHILRFKSILVKTSVNEFLAIVHSPSFLTANVSSWLFDGIEDPLLKIAKKFPQLGFNFPSRFGWMYDHNNTIEYEGAYTMNTGAGNFSKLAHVEKWKYSNRTPYRDECGKVRGGSGDFWALTPEQKEVSIFISDVCTSLLLEKSKNVEVGGLQGVFYNLSKTQFDNGHFYTEMSCYCDENDSADCLPIGALNISLCTQAPAFISSPHFYGADSIYRQDVIGMKPTPSHEFGIAIEPTTGITLIVNAQIQFNLFIRHVSGITLNNILPPDTMLPMFWTRQSFEADPDTISISSYAIKMQTGLSYGFIALLVTGAALLAAGCIFIFKAARKSTNTYATLSNAE